VNPNATDEDLAIVVQQMMVFDDVYLEPRQLAEAIRSAYPDQADRFNLPAESITIGDIRSLKQLAVELK